VSCEIPDLTEALESTRPTEVVEVAGGESSDDVRSPSPTERRLMDKRSYFVEGALTIMVATYEEDVVSF
jgi:hypothetical protein